jgi:O-antigen/teichoic acid export membrane protein
VNVLGLVAINALGALSGFVTVRVLGKEAVGLLAVAFGIGEFGRAISACTHIPSIVEYHKADADEREVFGSSLAVKLFASTLFVALMVALAPLIETLFHVPPAYLVLASLVIVFVTGYEVGAARMEATNRMVRSNLILSSGAATSLALVLLLAVTHTLTVTTSILATLAANLVMTVAAWSFSRPKGALRVRRDLAVGMTRYGLRIVWASLLSQGLLWTVTLMVSHLRGLGDTGVYNIVFQLTLVMVTASSAMGVALVPALSKLRGAGQDTSRGYQRGTVIALAMSLTIALAWIVLGRLILGLYGPAFVVGYPALVVLTLFGISAALTVPAATMLTIHGRAGLLSTLSLTQLVINIPLSYVLISRFGLVGAAASATSVYALGTILSWVAVRRTTGAWPLSRAAVDEVRAFAAAQWRRMAT